MTVTLLALQTLLTHVPEQMHLPLIPLTGKCIYVDMHLSTMIDPKTRDGLMMERYEGLWL